GVPGLSAALGVPTGLRQATDIVGLQLPVLPHRDHDVGCAGIDLDLEGTGIEREWNRWSKYAAHAIVLEYHAWLLQIRRTRCRPLGPERGTTATMVLDERGRWRGLEALSPEDRGTRTGPKPQVLKRWFEGRAAGKDGDVMQAVRPVQHPVVDDRCGDPADLSRHIVRRVKKPGRIIRIRPRQLLGGAAPRHVGDDHVVQ